MSFKLPVFWDLALVGVPAVCLALAAAATTKRPATFPSYVSAAGRAAGVGLAHGEAVIPCQRPQSREDSEPCAQWVATRASVDAAYWTKLSGVLGLVGLFGVAGALSLTMQSNAISRKGSLVQLRAYLDLDELKSPAPHKNIGEMIVNSTPYSIKNYGVTPAIDVTLREAWHWGPIQPSYNFLSDKKIKNVGVIAPGDCTDTLFYHIELPNEGAREGWEYYWLCEVCYSDVFGERHFTRTIMTLSDKIWGVSVGTHEVG